MKNKILVIIFVVFVSGFGIINILVPDKEISYSERRKLMTFPKFEFQSGWIEDVEQYFLSHFVLRDEFRSLKARYNYGILRKLDNNGVQIKDDFIFKNNYPTDRESINNFCQKITKVSSSFTENNKVYMMIIPDKNYYFGEGDFLQLDYDYIYDKIKFKNIKMLDVREILELNDYYKSDTHWRQERLLKVVDYMGEEMELVPGDERYKKNEYSSFYGVYAKDNPNKIKGEKLFYLTSDTLNRARVEYLENATLTSVYNTSKLKGMDSYEVYLDGASSYITIYNDLAETERELVVFRDSFGSSLVPLLVDKYKKITVIDNRYISSDLYRKYLNFDNQDILFMYSTLVVNDSRSLKG